MGADTAAELLAEGERLVAEIDSLPAGPKRLAAYLRLKDVTERAELVLQEERS